ncbi:MAG: Uma2 family endonuclease [Cyanobacteria bacterium SBC]|nr:Uma2 family endonuclease [Cyanobacteria bacterium SBC]
MVTNKSIAQSEIVYPERDGKPMADNTKQYRWRVAIQQNLDRLFADDPLVFVAGNLFWYPVEGRPDIVTAPDVFVVFGRPKDDRGSYRQWDEAGIAPQMVFEILSPGNSKMEMSKKLLFYDRYGVEEYYLYDPDRNDLEGWQQTDDGLDSIESIEVGWVSPRLGIRFERSEETLQIYRPDGTLFYSFNEINRQLNEAEQRATEAERRSSEMEELLQQYRERFGDLPESE